MSEVKAIRVELGLNQREFGKRLGMSQSRVAHWERGADTPDTRTLLAMRWLLHEHRSKKGSPRAAAKSLRDPAAVTTMFITLGGHSVIADGSGVPVTDLEAMQADARIWSQYRPALTAFARTSGFDLDADKLVMRAIGKDTWREAS
jgi:DNA-binding XRE family transcriptional regulator